jgi:flagellar hook-associated protein 2
MAVSSANLDVNSIVSQLMTLERQPLTVIDNKEASYQAKISAYGTVNSALASLQSAISALTQPNLFKNLAVTATDINVVSGSATTSAVPGSYNIVVDQIAKNHTVRSTGAYTSSGDTFNTGKLSIQVGNAAAVDIDITGDNNSLSGIRNAINNANAGVTASIINDGTNQRLVVTSKTLGSGGAVKITATDDGSGGTFGLSGLTTNSAAVSASTYTDTDTFETGKLTIQVGNGSAVDIDLSSGNSTLAGVRDAINNANAGVTASIADDGLGNQRLVVASNTPGAAVTVTATPDGNGGGTVGPRRPTMRSFQ